MKAIALAIGMLAVTAQAGERNEVTFGGFVDTYYAYDTNRPAGDRAFTTAASRHNEFSINLAFLEAKLEKPRVRGRLALQLGSSVYTNYATERRYNPGGAPQLADVLRNVQEAYGGYRLGEGLWLDAGIFLSHIGFESFISKDNWTYTRSRAADFSPYYQAGLRLNYRANARWAFGLHVMNGWQNTIETNADKAVGLQATFTPSETWSVTYNNFLGRETELRFFNDLIVKVNLSPLWSVAVTSDVGFQNGATWFGEALLTQVKLSDTIAVGGRLEAYFDRSQVIVATGTANGFQAYGGSLNLDWQPDPAFVLRNEVRTLRAKDAVFLAAAGLRDTSTLLVTSVGLSF